MTLQWLSFRNLIDKCSLAVVSTKSYHILQTFCTSNECCIICFLHKPFPLLWSNMRLLNVFTFTKVGQWFEDPPPKSCHGVLDTGAQTQHALEVRLLQQQLPVCTELVCSAQQGSDTMYKFWHQASVRVIRLAVVICHNLENNEKGEKQLQARVISD